MYTETGTEFSFYAADAGDGDFAVERAHEGCKVPEQGNVYDGDEYKYYAQTPDGSQWEQGSGAYLVAAHTLSRTKIIHSSNRDELVVFKVPPIVDVFGLTSAPKQITRRQLLLVLMLNDFISPAEAVAAANSGTIPTIIASYIDSLPSVEQNVARITWASMSVCQRSDPMLAALAAANGLSEAQLDALFLQASQL